MLSWGCRRFRARFSPAEPTTAAASRAHRDRCAPCADYAQALERAAALRLPLPASLRDELASLPTAAAGGLLPGRLPVPELPLPAALRFRLQGIAQAAKPVPAASPRREKPPAWILSPRYAIAASLLLTTLSAVLLGHVVNPAELPNLGDRAAGFVRREVSPPLVQAGKTGEKKLQALHATAASRYGEIKGGLGASVRDLENRISTLTQREIGGNIAKIANFAGRLLPASQGKNRGGTETPGRERRQP